MAKKSKTKIKICNLSKFGWKRVAKCIMRFGWRLDDAEEEITTTTTDYYEGDELVKTETTSKSRIWLTFYRNRAWYTNLGSIAFLEFLFNIASLLRKLLGFLLPLFIPACILVVLLGGGQAFAIFESPLPKLFPIVFFGWITFIFVEELLSRIAGNILKVNIRR